MIKERVPPRVSEAVGALRPNRSFQVFVEWLEGSLESTREENDTFEGNDLTRNQGCAITLKKILKTIAASD